MTLKPYQPEDLDAMALRLLDLAAIFRDMARLGREHELTELRLNDKKALEWYGKLERWVIRAHADLDAELRLQRAQRRAQEMLES